MTWPSLACVACNDLLSPCGFCLSMCCDVLLSAVGRDKFCRQQILPLLSIQVIHSKQTRKTPRDMARRDEVAPRMYQPYREDRRRDDWRYDRSWRDDRGSSRSYRRCIPITLELFCFPKGIICCAWLCSDVNADAIWNSDDCRGKSDKLSQRQMSCDLYAGVRAHAPKALGGDGTAAETGDASGSRSGHSNSKQSCLHHERSSRKCSVKTTIRVSRLSAWP